MSSKQTKTMVVVIDKDKKRSVHEFLTKTEAISFVMSAKAQGISVLIVWGE